MSSILTVAGMLVGMLFIIILSILIWKTMEYFNTLPESNKNRPLLAWDVLILFLMQVYIVIKLLMV